MHEAIRGHEAKQLLIRMFLEADHLTSEVFATVYKASAKAERMLFEQTGELKPEAVAYCRSKLR